jgi:alanine dehydrogenase
VLKYAKIVVDDIERASHSREINIPLSEGQLKVEDIYGTLGEIVINMKEGWASEGETTIFDSTGLAIQDIICAKLVYDKANKN